MVVRLLAALCALLSVGGAAGLIWCATVLIAHPGALHARAPLLQGYGCAFIGVLVLGLALGGVVRDLLRREQEALGSGLVGPARASSESGHASLPTLRATDTVERELAVENVILPGETRWAIYDRPTRTLWFGGRATKTHLTVAEESGLLRNDADYYRPGPAAKMCGGYVVRSADGPFSFDAFSGTFPGTPEAVAEAEDALQGWCLSRGLRWHAHRAADRLGT